MLIAGRNGMMVESRPYDAEVEYLESDGSQYINTGVNCSSLDFTISTICNKFPTCGWCHEYVVSGTWIGMRQSGSNCLSWNKNYNTQFNASQYIADFFSSIVYDSRNGLYVNGNMVKQFLVAQGDDNIYNNPLVIFAQYDFYRRGIVYGKTKIKRFSVSVNSILMCDSIAVRRTIDGVSVGEMYDRVTGTFLERHGTFIIGPDIAGGGVI